MDARRAQDLMKHIFQDEDNGMEMMRKLPLSDSIQMMTKILPECMKKAEEKDNVNDIGFFGDLTKKYEAVVVEKLKEAKHLWVVYSETTGYPYIVDKDMLVLYDYTNHAIVEERLAKAGYKVSIGVETPDVFKNEIAHMYRNGYKNIRFIDGKSDAFTVPRESFYNYEEFFNEEYMTNPALEQTMLEFFQEVRKDGSLEARKDMLKKAEAAMTNALKNAEFMVPCTKEEKDDSVEIAHPFIDVTERVSHEDGQQVIAIPAFTDGYEMDKCYEGHHENMLYTFKEMYELVEELDAAGVILNALGVSYFMPAELLKSIQLNI
ncbi:MAG: SseB family protein [Eubacteriales bacterium]|nr:SseB family protein [Eubacteriales bacterium]